MQVLFRLASARLNDGEVDQLFDLACSEGRISLIRSTARFNRHHHLIRALFQYPAARKILLRQIVASSESEAYLFVSDTSSIHTHPLILLSDFNDAWRMTSIRSGHVGPVQVNSVSTGVQSLV